MTSGVHVQQRCIFVSKSPVPAQSPLLSIVYDRSLECRGVCEQYKEVGQLPRRRSDVFSSVALRVVQRFAKRRRLRAAFKRLEKAPGRLFELVLEVGKVAFDRLKHKDLSYFELEEEDLSPEAVELGFLEHMQATSLSEADQYGFRHLTVQEYLAALYACSEMLKKAGDVAKLVEEIGCGPEAGHLNTFWVFVAGLLDCSLHEELFGAIAGVDTTTRGVHARDNVAGSGSAKNAHVELVDGSGGDDEEGGQSERRIQAGTPQPPLEEYRFLLLLHCYNEATINSRSEHSACVIGALKRTKAFDRERGAVWTHHDTRAISRTIGHHSDTVEQVDLLSLSLDEAGLQRILPALNTCTSLKELQLGTCTTNHLTPTRIDGVMACTSLESLILVGLLVDGIFHGQQGDTYPMTQLKCLELRYIELSGGDHKIGSCIRHLPALRKCVLSHVLIPDQVLTAVVAPALQMCKQLQTLEVLSMHLTGDRMSAFASILFGLPHLERLVLNNLLVGDEVFFQLAPGLGCCCQLRRLQLSNCGLTDSLSMALLASILPCLHHLQKLCVDRNEIGDAGFAVLLIGLEECSKLRDLNLAKIGLTSSQSLLAIARLLGRLVRLVTLDLSENECGGMSSAIQLCYAVEQHSSLVALDPPDGMDEDIVIWLDSLLLQRAERRSSVSA